MKRLAMAALGLALVVGAVAVVFAVWASVDEAPWERTASTRSPRVVYAPERESGAPLTVCDEARKAISVADGFSQMFASLIQEWTDEDRWPDPDVVRWNLQMSQNTRHERLLALQLINEACPPD